MKESELAELFNQELDRVLRGGEEADFSPDPGAMNLAAALARADFSADSAVKVPLRRRLEGPGKEAPGLAAALRALLGNSYARAALAAACLLLAVLPLARRSGAPVAVPAPAERKAAPPAGPAGGAGGSAAAERPVSARAEKRAGGLFGSVPMASLRGEPIAEFPIGPAGKGNPIVIAEGREVKLSGGSRVVWETGNAVFIYERRVTSAEEFFERRSI